MYFLQVADCICLMSMDKCDAIPIDTHVFQAAMRYYVKYPQISKHKAAKSVTPKIYKDIGMALYSTLLTIGQFVTLLRI